MTSASLNNLWNYLQGLALSPSNQRWLGEKLIEASFEKKGSAAKKAFLNELHRSLQEVKLAQEGKLELQSADDFIAELKREG